MKIADYSPGVVIADRYKILSVIGQGGVGVILQAIDLVLNLDMAIKILAVDHTGVNAARLQREAISAGSLTHPNIARILHFGQLKDGAPFMVMELLPGFNLAQFIEEQGRIDYIDAIAIFLQICEGLDFAHKRNIIHRDIKPSNIMLVYHEGRQQVKLLDFGIAKTQTQKNTLTAEGILIGSPFYVSPEQAQGKELDYRSDIYSLGCLMFECLTGKPPFVGQSAIETITMHRKQKPQLISSVVPESIFPDELIEIIDKCLRKEPADRPEDLQKVITQLNQALLSKHDPTETRKTKGHTQDNKWTLLAIAGGVILTGLCTVLYLQKKEETNQSLTKKSLPAHSSGWDTYRKVRKANQEIKFRTSIQDNWICVETISDLLNDADLKELQGKKIDELNLIGCTFDGSGIEYLTDSNLSTLKVLNCNITDTFLMQLAKIDKLVELRIDSPDITDAGIQYLNNFKSLAHLELSCPKVTDQGLKTLCLPSLKKLVLLTPKATDALVEPLKNFKNLNTLSLSDTNTSKDLGVKLSGLKGLRSIELSGLQSLSLDSITAFERMKILNLKLKDIPLNDAQYEAIGKIKTIAVLDLAQSPCTSHNLKHIINLPKLYALDLTGARVITDEMMEELAKTHLVNLDLRNTSINDKQLRKLIKLKSLERLILRDCENLSTDAAEDFARDFRNIWKKKIKIEAFDFYQGGIRR
ncbi:MAG: protein kinase [Candidatus Melainabacteria bacterium]|nr:MAG: protein kinase [Candidatus Melainabacteria bacterium]